MSKTIHAAVDSDRQVQRPARQAVGVQRNAKAASFLYEEEIERLLSVIRSICDRAIFRVAYHAGLRASEVSKLDLRD